MIIIQKDELFKNVIDIANTSKDIISFLLGSFNKPSNVLFGDVFYCSSLGAFGVKSVLFIHIENVLFTDGFAARKGGFA